MRQQLPMRIPGYHWYHNDQIAAWYRAQGRTRVSFGSILAARRVWSVSRSPMLGYLDGTERAVDALPSRPSSEADTQVLSITRNTLRDF